jgi:hypothetical protein
LKLVLDTAVAYIDRLQAAAGDLQWLGFLEHWTGTLDQQSLAAQAVKLGSSLRLDFDSDTVVEPSPAAAAAVGGGGLQPLQLVLKEMERQNPDHRCAVVRRKRS